MKKEIQYTLTIIHIYEYYATMYEYVESFAWQHCFVHLTNLPTQQKMYVDKKKLAPQS